MEEKKELDFKVFQRNDIVQRSRYTLSLSQQKLLRYFISFIKQDPVISNDGVEVVSDSQDYELEYHFSVKDYGNLLGINIRNGDIYKRIKTDLLAILRCIVLVKQDNGHTTAVKWLDNVDINEGSGDIKIRFDKSITPYLYSITNRFTCYKISEILPFKSKYSICLYELFLSHAYEKTFTISVDELRWRLAIDKDEYFNAFKRISEKILNPSLKEINELTSLNVSFNKMGKPVKEISFVIKNKL